MAWTAPRTWANGEIVTQTMLNTDVRDNMGELWHEVAYVEFAANVSAAAGSEVAPVDVVSSGAITYVANPIIVEFFSPAVTLPGGSLSLWDGATDLGRLNDTSSSIDLITAAVTVSRRLTPTAAAHTYKIRCWGGGSVGAGAGGVGTRAPGYIRILQKGGA